MAPSNLFTLVYEDHQWLGNARLALDWLSLFIEVDFCRRPGFIEPSPKHMPFPPPAQKGMTQLNREVFKRVISVYGVRIPATKVMSFQKQIRGSVVEPKLLTPR